MTLYKYYAKITHDPPTKIIWAHWLPWFREPSEYGDVIDSDHEDEAGYVSWSDISDDGDSDNDEVVIDRALAKDYILEPILSNDIVEH